MLNSTDVSLQNEASRTLSPSFSAETREPQSAIVEECVLPEQFFKGAVESASHWTGERRLLLAVLENAAESFLRHRHATTRRGKRLFREDKEWFWAKDRGDLFSFESICGHLSLDPDYIRRGLKRALQASADPIAEPQRATNSAQRRLNLVPVKAEEKKTDRGMPRETLQQLIYEIAA